MRALSAIEVLDVSCEDDGRGGTAVLLSARLAPESRLGLPFAINSVTLVVGATVLTALGEWETAAALGSASAGVGGIGAALGTRRLRRRADSVGTALQHVLRDAAITSTA